MSVLLSAVVVAFGLLGVFAIGLSIGGKRMERHDR